MIYGNHVITILMGFELTFFRFYFLDANGMMQCLACPRGIGGEESYDGAEKLVYHFSTVGQIGK